MLEKDLIIIGSGPAGLKAGEEAAKHGLDYLIIEKRDVEKPGEKFVPTCRCFHLIIRNGTGRVFPLVFLSGNSM